MKKYRFYLDNYHKFHGIIENEEIFEQLSFANVGISSRNEHSSELTDMEVTKEDQSFQEEHLVAEEVESEDASDYEVEMDAGGLWTWDLESKKRKRESESEYESEPKKQFVIVDTLAEAAAEKTESARSSRAPEEQDEFYYYGKKIAIELSTLFRELARRDRNLASKCEMEVLQLVMKFREGLDS